MFTVLQKTIHPIDEAFVAGTLELPTTAETVQQAAEGHWDDSILLVVIATITLIAGIAFLRNLLNITPSLIGCLFRSKECYNLENSAQLSRERNIIFFYSVIPTCLVASYYRLWRPGFMDNMGYGTSFLITLGVVLVYIGARIGLVLLLTPQSYNIKTYKIADRVFPTFFIIASVLIIVTAAALGMFKVGFDIAREVLLWELVGLYALQIVRKLQILGSCMPVFSTILYLCALEIIPTGLLVVTAVFL